MDHHKTGLIMPGHIWLSRQLDYRAIASYVIKYAVIQMYSAQHSDL